MFRLRRTKLGFVVIVMLVTSAGWDDLREPVGIAPESSETVARRGTATVEGAYRQFLAMAASHGRVTQSGEVDAMTFEEVVAQLESLCVIDAAWSYAPHACLRRDVLAYMSCSYLGCRPGLVTGLFGMTRRYAHREMLYQRIIRPGAPASLVSGSELLSVVTRVSRRVESHRDVQLSSDEIH